MKRHGQKLHRDMGTYMISINLYRGFSNRSSSDYLCLRNNQLSNWKFSPIFIAFILLGLLLLSNNDVFAKSIWCNPANTGVANGTRKNTGYKTLHKALSIMASGDTIMIANGDWRNTSGMFINKRHSPPDGTEENFSRVWAESDWNVKLPYIHIETPKETQGYMEFKGIVFDNRYIGYGIGHVSYHMHHTKFIRCGFLCHGLKGNSHACGFGSVDSSRAKNQYNLMEECIAWGSGRYIFYSKYGKFNVFRRCVARHDYHDGAGTKDDGQIFNFRAYACDHSVYQNCISIDSDRIEYFTSLQGEAGGFWIGDAHGSEKNEIRGCISIKSVTIPFYLAGSNKGEGSTIVKNSIALDVPVGGYTTLSAFFLESGSNVNASNLLGIGAFKKGQDGFYAKKDGSFFVKNSILRDIEDVGLKVTNAENINHFNAGKCVSEGRGLEKKLSSLFSSCWGPGSTDYDPLKNGLVYPTRIETGSKLASAGLNGKRCGPEILKKIGISGTLYGEPGWNKITEEKLWPFPNEKKIRDLMRETVKGVTGKYGFCADGQTLSNYIWGYLGNPVPPFNLTAASGDRTVTLKWDHPAEIVADSITGFNIYKLTDQTKTLAQEIITGPRNCSITISGLLNGSTYEFAVTTLDKIKGESGLSYKVRVTPKNTEKMASNESAPAKIEKFEKSMEPMEAPDKKEFINKLGMAFVFIPPDSFEMGILSDKDAKMNNAMPYQVILTKSLYMQTTEVTQGQWKKLMGKNPSFFKECGDDCPVDQVSWNEVQQFIERLNRIEGTDRYRLPTEAEWEYACRSGSKTPFSFGKCLSAEQVNYNGNYPSAGCRKNGYRKKPISVNSFVPNAWGLHDMHGNVWEWCGDWLGKYPTDSVVNPKGPSSGLFRVIRGGGWNSYDKACRSGNRSGIGQTKRFANLGFRIVRDR